MKYNEIELQSEDIMWFGIDVNGFILCFTSAGCGNIPEYVCRSKEETDKLESYFLNNLPQISEAQLLIETSDNIQVSDAVELAKKGIFSYDASFDEGHEGEYSKIAYPETPLNVAELPENIKEILLDHRIVGNAVNDMYISVKHAY